MLPTHDTIEKLLPYLTDAERNELVRIIGAINLPWMPLPGPQLLASMSKADVVGFGGAAGGGKSDWLLGTALTRHTKSLILRQEAVQLPGLVQRTTELLGGSRDGYNGQDKIWRIPGTNKIMTFGHATHPDDWEKYQGRARDFLGLDEASNFLESVVRALMGWVRTTDPNQQCQTGLAFNPPTRAEGRWIIDFFAPWLDPQHLAPALPGELRFFAMIDGDEVEMPDGQPFMHKGEVINPRSRTFIPSRINDNPFLMNTGYRDTLQSFPEPLRSQMLYGDFMAGVMDDAYQVIPTAWVQAAMDRWKDKPVKPPMDSLGVDVARGGGDQTVLSARHGWWFDRLKALPGTATPDGYSTAAEVMKLRRDEAVIHLDVIGVGASPYDILRNQNVQIVGVDARQAAPGPDKTGRLKFKNYRSWMWWRMRELLDPSANNDIQLPPDKDLMKELCAPTWSYGDSSVIRVSSREDIIDRVGYSPDRATAVVQAAIETPKLRAIERMGGGVPVTARRSYDPLNPGGR
jgi:hypothetical protein